MAIHIQTYVLNVYNCNKLLTILNIYFARTVLFASVLLFSSGGFIEEGPGGWTPSPGSESII